MKHRLYACCITYLEKITRKYKAILFSADISPEKNDDEIYSFLEDWALQQKNVRESLEYKIMFVEIPSESIERCI